MNKIISIMMLISMIVTGLASYHLFRLSEYNASALFTIASYLSMVFSIYALWKHSPKPVLK